MDQVQNQEINSNVLLTREVQITTITTVHDYFHPAVTAVASLSSWWHPMVNSEGWRRGDHSRPDLSFTCVMREEPHVPAFVTDSLFVPCLISALLFFMCLWLTPLFLTGSKTIPSPSLDSWFPVWPLHSLHGFHAATPNTSFYYKPCSYYCSCINISLHLHIFVVWHFKSWWWSQK